MVNKEKKQACEILIFQIELDDKIINLLFLIKKL